MTSVSEPEDQSSDEVSEPEEFWDQGLVYLD